MGKTAVAGGVASAGLCQRVVVGAGKVDAGLARHKVGARTGDREHLGRDAAGVHVGEAGLAKVGEFVAFGGLRPDEVGAGKAAAGDGIGGDAGDDAGHGVVFFQGDDAHVFSPCGWAGGWHVGGRRATHPTVGKLRIRGHTGPVGIRGLAANDVRTVPDVRHRSGSRRPIGNELETLIDYHKW